MFNVCILQLVYDYEYYVFFFFQAEDGIRDLTVTGVQTCALPISCQDMDRAGRQVITAVGYGPFFTHRLGHGLGMDGHEPPYLVEGNALGLEPGIDRKSVV